MKKVLLLASLFVGSVFTMNAQTTVWSDDFNSGDISGWTLIDVDGDGNDFEVFDGDYWGLPTGQLQCIVSWSYLDATDQALSPNNWIVSPVIDLSSASGIITLDWNVGSGAAAQFLEDAYAVYVLSAGSTFPTSESYLHYEATIPQYDFTNGAFNGARTIDISSFAGQEIQFAFRHFDTTDMYSLLIDDVAVVAENFASVNNALAGSFSVYPNPVKDVLNISNSVGAEINSVIVADINGRTVKQVNAVSQIDIADLNAGVYFVNINSNEGSLTKKIVKQ